ISSVERNGGSAGVVSNLPGPLAGTSSAFLSRNCGESSRKGATSAVVSIQSVWPGSGTAVMTWSNWPGEGTSASILRDEFISAGDARKPAAINIDDSRVCLSLQSPYWFANTSAAAWGW